MDLNVKSVFLYEIRHLLHFKKRVDILFLLLFQMLIGLVIPLILGNLMKDGQGHEDLCKFYC